MSSLSFFYTLILLTNVQLHAQINPLSTIENLYIKSLCLTSDMNCSKDKLPATLKLKIQACEMLVQSESCQQFIKNEPEFTGSLQKCTPEQFCEDYLWQELDSLSGCKDGFLIGTGENLDGIYNQLSNFWDQTEKNAKLKTQFLKACEPSLECRQELAKNIPIYSKLSPQELMKIPILGLYQKQIDTERFGMNRNQLKGARSKAQELKSETQSSELPQTSPRDKSFIKAAQDWLNKKNIRLECVDKRTKAELICWGAAYIIDPLLVAGAVTKVARPAAQLFSKYASKKPKAAHRETDSRAPIQEKRQSLNQNYEVSTQNFVPLKLNSLSNVPESIVLKTDAKTQKNYFVTAVKTNDGQNKKMITEFQMDKTTGAINANDSGGKKLFESMAQAHAGKSYLAFIDVRSLRVVNTSFKGGGELGQEMGDIYLKQVSEIILREGKDKVTLARTGGDEFGLIIHETDPQKAQELMDRTRKAIRNDKTLKEIFREEKISRVQAYKKENTHTTNENLEQISKVQTPDISVGIVPINSSATPLATYMENAEELAKTVKSEQALLFGLSAEKYGVFKSPSEVPRPTSYVEIEKPSPVVTSNSKASGTSELSSGQIMNLPTIISRPTQQIKRFDDSALIVYENELKQKIYVLETYSHDPVTKNLVKTTDELPIRENTGMLDGDFPKSQELLMRHFRSNPNNVLVMPKLDSLPELNYFSSGTKAGDEALAAVSNAIKTELRSDDLVFKLSGKDFLISFENGTNLDIAKVQNRISEAIKNDPSLKKLIEKERVVLTNKISTLEKLNNKTPEQIAELASLKKREAKGFEMQMSYNSAQNTQSNSNLSYLELKKLLDKR